MSPSTNLKTKRSLTAEHLPRGFSDPFHKTVGINLSNGHAMERRLRPRINFIWGSAYLK